MLIVNRFMTSKSHVGQCARVNVFVSFQFSKVFFSALLEPDDVVRRKLVLHFRPDCFNKNTFHCHVIGQFHHHLLLFDHGKNDHPIHYVHSVAIFKSPIASMLSMEHACIVCPLSNIYHEHNKDLVPGS